MSHQMTLYGTFAGKAAPRRPIAPPHLESFEEVPRKMQRMDISSAGIRQQLYSSHSNALNNQSDNSVYQAKPQYSANVQNRRSADQSMAVEVQQIPDEKPKHNIPVFTGTIEKVIRWRKTYVGFCLFEVYGPYLSSQPGRFSIEKVLLMRDRRGPVLQVVYYEFENRELPKLTNGDVIRCIGRMIGPNKLKAETVKIAQEDELLTLPRLASICDHSIVKTVTNHNI